MIDNEDDEHAVDWTQIQRSDPIGDLREYQWRVFYGRPLTQFERVMLHGGLFPADFKGPPEPS